MKKRAVMMVAAVCAALLAGVTASAAEQEDFFARMKEANAIDTLQANYAMSWMDSERYFADGTVENLHAYVDSERYIRDNAGDVTADKDGDVYGYNLEQGTAFRYLFVDGAYENFRARENLVPWGGYEDEDVRRGTVEDVDDTHSVATVEVDALPYTALLAHYGYAVAEGDVLRYEFTADKTSAEITGTQVYLVQADGTQTLFEKGTVVLGGTKEPEEPDMEMREWIFSDDMRTLTVIADAGTAQEKTYMQTAGKGCWIVVAYADEYAADGRAYDDAACTQVHQYSEDEIQYDVTLYIRRAGSAAQTGLSQQPVTEQAVAQQPAAQQPATEQAVAETNAVQTESAQTNAAQTESAQTDAYQNMAQCPFCGEWFSTLDKEDGSLSDFRFHTQLEMEYRVSMAQCPICGGWFSTYEGDGQPSEYTLHQIDEEEMSWVPDTESVEMVQCEYCGEWFEAGNAFRNHICPARDAAYGKG